MNNSNFIKLLKTLKQKEMTEFCKFVKKEGPEQSKDMFIFVDYLKEQYPDFRKQKMSGEYIGQKLFPETKDNVKKILTLQEKLILILNHFKNQKLSNFVKLLKTLNRNEMNEFCKFVEGRTLKQRKDRTDFVEYLKEQHLDGFPWHKMSKEHIGQKLFPKDENNIRKVQALQEKLMSILEDYLIYTELEKQKTKRDFLLLDVYKRRKLDDLFFNRIKKIEKGWEKEKPAGIEQLHNEYLLKKERFLHPSFSVVRRTPITLNDIICQLDKYYFAIKLYWTLCLYQLSFLIDSNTNTERGQYFIDEILNICLQSNFQDVPQIQLLSQLLQAFIKKDFENYMSIKKQFMSNLHLYDEYEKNDIWVFLTEKYKQEKSKALEKLFELKREATENGLIFENGYIPVINFRNIVNTAAVWNVQWAEDFIERYSEFLEDKERDDTISLCKAVVDFNKGNYDNVLRRLAYQVNVDDALYEPHVRSIKLKCYYELDDDLFYSTVKSFSGFLDRNKTLSPINKKAFYNFIYFIKKLKKAKLIYGANVGSISREIIAVDEIAHRSWLISKAKV